MYIYIYYSNELRKDNCAVFCSLNYGVKGDCEYSPESVRRKRL